MVSTLGAIDHKEATATPPPSLKKKKTLLFSEFLLQHAFF